MGTSANVRCSACGYKTSLRLGGGRANHRVYAAWPVNCDDCAETTTANFKQVPLVCRTCSGSNVAPVANDRNWVGDGKTNVNWGDLELTDGHYRCPKCDAFELRFTYGMMHWD